MIYPVPDYLNMLQPWLESKTLESQEPVSYSADKWRAKFGDNNLEYVLDKHPEQINRSQIAELGKAAYASGYEGASVSRLFWGMMLWGWGTIGNGPTRVSWIIETTPETESVLCHACQFVMQGNIEEAYNFLSPQGNTRLKYFNEAYFSKFLYFVGLGCGLQRYPLIIDSKIDAGLKALLGTSAPQQYTQKGYMIYLNFMHDWADRLRCRADSIEYALFILPSIFWQK